jgi:hypothetical protein
MEDKKEIKETRKIKEEYFCSITYSFSFSFSFSKLVQVFLLASHIITRKNTEKIMAN